MSQKKPKQKPKPDAKPAPPPPATGFVAAWNRFFFAERDPRLASVLRIGYGVLLIIYLAIWIPDLRMWFSDAGALPVADGRLIINEDAPSLIAWLPQHDWLLYTCFGLFFASAVLLLVGWQTRIQAVLVLIWLTAFQHRNIAIVDGEDTIFRLFAFYLALCPAGWAFSIDAKLRKGGETPIPWGLRLFQIQMTAIYLSSAIQKSSGSDWTSGKALYYVARLDDSFGRLPVPDFMFEHLWLIKLMTWSVLVLEWALPVFLWMKRSRKAAIIVGIVFHLAIDYTMNLFLFHWIMILGLMSFAEFDELLFWRARKAALPRATASDQAAGA